VGYSSSHWIASSQAPRNDRNVVIDVVVSHHLREGGDSYSRKVYFNHLNKMIIFDLAVIGCFYIPHPTSWLLLVAPFVTLRVLRGDNPQERGRT
jgi:hypothetical protein